jgi:hypothetical protein
MKHLVMPMMLSVSLLVASAGPALAVNVHNPAVGGTGVKGPPDQSIRSPQTGSVVPGNMTSSTKSKGSPFGSTAFSTTKYAGAQPQNTKMNGPTGTHLVAAQYDVAGFQQSHKHR